MRESTLSPYQFQPARGLSNPHLQTLFSPLLRKRPGLSRWRERITLSDGDFVDLDWAGPTAGPIVMILHGLTGSSNSLYALGLQQALLSMGIRSLVLNFRGCSSEPNLLPRSYHAGDTADLAEVYQIIKKRHPHTPVAIAGYSLGGNVLLKWLGEMGDQSTVSAAVAVSVPFELEKGAARLNQGFSRIYRNKMLNELKRSFIQKQKAFQQQRTSAHLTTLAQLGDLKRHKTFYEFDEHVISKLHGFSGARDYYQKSSCRQYLNRICTPTLIIHSKDDPFTTPDSIPTHQEVSEAVRLEITDQGGHVGFVSGKLSDPVYWLEKRIPIFLKDYLKPQSPEPQNESGVETTC